MEDLTGKQLGPYRIEGPLGEGGMAAVYKAYQSAMDRYVAMKILPRHFASDPQFTARFDQEARIIAKLQHVHILPVHDYGQAEGYTYIVMPFISTGTLADLLRNGPLPLDRVRSIISQVGEALGYAHAHGVIHRDVKPSNILIDDQGYCRLTDFGISKMVEGTLQLTQTGAMAGTPAYMSPEQIQGEILDGRSDLYSLGVVLYEMVTGKQPYRADTPAAVLVKHLHDPLPNPRSIVADLNPAIEEAILKSLAKARQDRYPDAAQFVRAVQSAVAEAQAAAPTSVGTQAEMKQTLAGRPGVSGPTVVGRQRRSTPWGLIAGALGLVVVVGAGLIVGIPLLTREPAAATSTPEAPPTQALSLVEPTATLTPILVRLHRAWSDPLFPLRPQAVAIRADGLLAALALVSPEAEFGLASGAGQNGARLYSADDPADPLMELDTDGAVLSLGWSDDGARLWTLNASGLMALWAVDRSGRTAVREWGATLTPALAADPDRAAELQPLLAATRGGGSATIHATGLDGWTTGWPGHGSGVRSFAWAADPVRLASGSEDSLVVWIDGRGRALVTGSGTIAGANALAWSPDGSRLATGGEDGRVRVWQADTRSEVMVFATDGDFTGMGAVHSLAWSPDGTWLAAGTTSGQVPVIDANSGQIRIIYEEGAPVLGIAWSADGTWIFTAVDAVSAAVGGRLHVWTLP